MKYLVPTGSTKVMPFHRYRPFQPVALPDRQWPNKTIDKAPIWCSVDLRDGNQALIEPMGIAKKCRMFDLLVRMGFNHIEVGFPAASETEFDFVRTLISERMIPEDVTIQVLTQARDHLIRRTFEAVRGADQAIVHVYNSTSELQRRVVFGLDCPSIKKIAVDASQLIKRLAAEAPETMWTFQYSPESFTGTELEFALEVCEGVLDVWEPSPNHKAIINLPATVEMSTPNVYADMIEWMDRHFSRRDSIVLSLHTHNDRGTSVAATELGLLAGADRVEGTLFGNGERTGNVDIITLAGNLMSQGVDPCLDFSDMSEIVQVAEGCTNILVHPRTPYAGELALTAFSGSHQDAIKKGQQARKGTNSPIWEVPYLPFDPTDIGRTYKGLLRINSQSGKGGIAAVMEHEHHLVLPRGLQIDFASVIQRIADRTGKELTASDLWEAFADEYLKRVKPFELIEYRETPTASGRYIETDMRISGVPRTIKGEGNGVIDAFVHALKTRGENISVVDFASHAVGHGSDAALAAFASVRVPGREPFWGVGLHTDTTKASLLAVISALNRS